MAGLDGVALRCSGLWKRYGTIAAVADLDLEIRQGECFGLLGPNGAGKTTAVEMFEGLNTPDSGTVEVLGQRWRGDGDVRLRSRIGVALQETQLADNLEVEEVVRLFRSFYPSGKTVEEVLVLLGLDGPRHTRVHQLSGGQRQRLAFATALVGDPELLFLDEPTTGLDPQARHRIWDVIADFRDRKGTVLLTTHYMEEAERLCDRVAILDHGRTIAQGTPGDLIRDLGAEQVVELTLDGDVSDDLLCGLPGVTRVARRGDQPLVGVNRIGEALPALLDLLAARAVPVRALVTRQASLEDVFIHHTGRGLRDA
ncbi:MAG: ABC transporter ATP-binding protein [Deltaproteobacteria bacterium]|nr:ABC transporter ATP-binding protein [Deltaproteobacteria bacterium]